MDTLWFKIPLKRRHWIYILIVVIIATITLTVTWFLTNDAAHASITTQELTTVDNIVLGLNQTLSLVEPFLDFGIEFMTRFTLFNSTLSDYISLSTLNNSIVNIIVTNLRVLYNVSQSERPQFEQQLSITFNETLTITDIINNTNNTIPAPPRRWYCPLSYQSPLMGPYKPPFYYPGLDLCHTPQFQPVLAQLSVTTMGNIVIIPVATVIGNRPSLYFAVQTFNGIVTISMYLDNVFQGLKASRNIDSMLMLNNTIFYSTCSNNRCYSGNTFNRNLSFINSRSNNILGIILLFPPISADLHIFYYILTAMIVLLIIAIMVVIQLAIQKNHVESSSKMLGYVNHELRNPLNAIQGMIDIALMDLTKETTVSLSGMDVIISNLGTAKNACDMMAHIVNDILDFQKIMEKKLILVEKVVQIKDIKHNLNKIIQTKLWEKPQLEYSFNDNDVIEVYTDETRLLQILLNFLTNAVKFTDTGYIHVNITQQSDGSIKFAVSDSGRGINPEDFGKIFKPYEQTGPVDSLRHGGIGLGLYLCKMLAEIMHAEIGFESVINKGSTFWLIIHNPPSVL